MNTWQDNDLDTRSVVVLAYAYTAEYALHASKVVVVAYSPHSRIRSACKEHIGDARNGVVLNTGTHRR